MMLFCLCSPWLHETQHSLSLSLSLSLTHTLTHTHTHVSFLHAKKLHTNHIQLGRPSITPVIAFRPQHSITRCTLNGPQNFLPTALRRQLPCLLTNAGDVICLPFRSHFVSYKLSRWYRYSETKGTRQPPQVHSSPLRPRSTEAM